MPNLLSVLNLTRLPGPCPTVIPRYPKLCPLRNFAALDLPRRRRSCHTESSVSASNPTMLSRSARMIVRKSSNRARACETALACHRSRSRRTGCLTLLVSSPPARLAQFSIVWLSLTIPFASHSLSSRPAPSSANRPRPSKASLSL